MKTVWQQLAERPEEFRAREEMFLGKRFRLGGGITLEEIEAFPLSGKTIQRELEEDVFKQPEYPGQWEKIIFFTDGTAMIFMACGVGVVETICCRVFSETFPLEEVNEE